MDAGREKQKARTTIFHQLLNPNATEGHVVPSVDDMKDEAFVMLSAAADTTGNAMTMAAYHVIQNPPIYERLIAELKAAFPDASTKLDYVTLEKLPYLVCSSPSRPTAVVELTGHRRLGSSRKDSGKFNDEGILSIPSGLDYFNRLSYGVPGRLPRTTPEPGAVFHGYKIPAGVCSTPPLSHQGSWS